MRVTMDAIAHGQRKQTFFDRWAPRYDWLLPSVFYQAVHQRLCEESRLPEGAHVLDLGCGTGKLLNRLAQQDPTLTGVGLDFSAAMLAEAQRKTVDRDRLTFVSGTTDQLPFAPNTFDAAFCTISFLHYPDPVAVLRAVATVLKPEGRFYLADYVPSKWTEQRFWDAPVPSASVQVYPKQARERLAAEAGLHCDRHVYLLGPIMLTVFAKVAPES